MADIYDEIINRTFQSTVMGTSPNAREEDTPSVMGLGAPMSGREGTTSQQDVEEDARPASATGAVMDYLQRLAVEYGYNAKAPQAGVRVPATTPTLGTSKMHDIYNTPLYDFMRNNEGGVKEDVTVWVRENRDLPSEVLDDYLSGIQDAYDYREREGITRTPSREGLTIIGERPMTDEELAPFTDTPIEVEELPSGSGLMTRPDATESVDITSDFVDEMERLEGLGGDTLLGNRKPTYSYGITEEKANEYGMKPEDYGSMREFAEAFAGRYMAEKEEMYSDIFAGKSDKEKIALHSYLYNAGKFYNGQLEALENNDMQGFIHELRDVVKSEGKAVTGLSKRRAEEANMLGESIEGWKRITEVRVRGTREKPVFDWVTEDGTVVESYESNVPLHSGSSMKTIKV